MKQIFRDYLTFNKRERNGIFVLLAIIVSLLIYLFTAPYFVENQKVDFSEFERELAAVQTPVSEEKNVVEEQIVSNKNTAEATINYFYFNPNNLPDADWTKLGLSPKQIHTIKNYEAKGGKFKSKADVRKMYCISEKMFLLLEPFIQIPINVESEHSTVPIVNKSVINKKTLLFELNTADSAQLVQLKGIGSYYAKTIIKYRNSLGGFISKEQLLEVWKFDQEKYDEVKNQITIDKSAIKKININNCTEKELKHPYLKWNMVNAIINYRDKHGKYSTVEEIKNTDLIDDITYNKIASYLIVE